MSGFLRFGITAVFALVFGVSSFAVAQEDGDGPVYVGGVKITPKASIASQTPSRSSIGAVGSGSNLSSAKGINWGLNGGIGIPGVGVIGGGVGGGANGGLGMGNVGAGVGIGTGSLGVGIGGAGTFNGASAQLACRVLQIPQGAFGALLMVVSGLIAVIGAALGMYKLALSTLTVGISAYLVYPLVSLFFGISCF